MAPPDSRLGRARRAVAAEVGALDTSPRALRSFGLVVGGVFVAIAAVIAWRRGWEVGPLVVGLGGPGAALALLGLVAPEVLRPVFVVWMGLAVVLGAVMTRVLLTLVFALIVVPIGLALRLAGKDPLDRRIDRARTTYWRPKVYDDDSAARLERYF